MFSKFDRDGTDSIDTSELGDALRFLGCNPLDDECTAMVADADGKSQYISTLYVIPVFSLLYIHERR